LWWQLGFQSGKYLIVWILFTKFYIIMVQQL
jgi:hypothetical protein